MSSEKCAVCGQLVPYGFEKDHAFGHHLTINPLPSYNVAHSDNELYAAMAKDAATFCPQWREIDENWTPESNSWYWTLNQFGPFIAHTRDFAWIERAGITHVCGPIVPPPMPEVKK